MKNKNIAIIGAGNIGISLARGLVASGEIMPGAISLIKRKVETISHLKELGFVVTDNLADAVIPANVLVLAVLPQQLKNVLLELRGLIKPGKHLVISVVSGVSVADIAELLENGVEVVRAMPNTAIAIRESMTCIASPSASRESIKFVEGVFNTVGETIEINEELMTSATALCACGIAFFLRAIRAASQGGIELGFHSDEALRMAAQTAKGAASLLASGAHPEREIDKVTSPKGCTIAGLNEMEFNGFSSALIRGIKVSAHKAGDLYNKGG
jgi:pyrroline-5-carboxylate reductase